MGIIAKLIPSALVTALVLLLAAVTATAAPGQPGPGGGDDRSGWVPSGGANEPSASAPVPAPTPVPGTPASTSAGQAKNDPAAPATPPGLAKKDPAGGSAAAIGPRARPMLGRSMAVTPVAGNLKVRLPHGTGYVPLARAGSIPPGTVVDARQGRLALQTAVAGGRTQTATFWGAVFEIRQARGARGLTEILLEGGRPAGCSTPAAALGRIASFSLGSGRPTAKTKASGLWAKDKHGRFRSRGRNSVATVRGTRWLTQETCAGTLTRVAEGAVEVRDTRRHKTVLVRAGHSYLARDAS